LALLFFVLAGYSVKSRDLAAAAGSQPAASRQQRRQKSGAKLPAK
jgi:hypothetical protein